MPKSPQQTTDRASDLLSAALRHVRDAELLLATSPDQSWHLAGFGPECARKACLGGPHLDKALGHELTAAADAVLQFALALDIQASRYEVGDLGTRYPALAEWRVESRYERTGTRTEPDARALVEQAAEFTGSVATELWMDGRVRVELGG